MDCLSCPASLGPSSSRVDQVLVESRSSLGQRPAAPSAPTRTVQWNLEPPMLRTGPWNWLRRPWGAGNWPFPDYEHVTWVGEGHRGKAQPQVS